MNTVQKTFTKSNLKQNMIVRTNGGRYGIVVLKDATDENCIKYFYDPDRFDEHGMNPAWCGVDSLNNYDENLYRLVPNPDDPNKLDRIFRIIQVYTLSEIWCDGEVIPWNSDINV